MTSGINFVIFSVINKAVVLAAPYLAGDISRRKEVKEKRPSPFLFLSIKNKIAGNIGGCPGDITYARCVCKYHHRVGLSAVSFAHHTGQRFAKGCRFHPSPATPQPGRSLYVSTSPARK